MGSGGLEGGRTELLVSCHMCTQGAWCLCLHSYNYTTTCIHAICNLDVAVHKVCHCTQQACRCPPDTSSSAY